MTEPRDEIGAWLDEPVEPLPPPPGAYQRIRRSARRRKRKQAIAATATAVAVVAGVVAAPRLATVLFPAGGSQAAAAGAQQTTSAAHPSGLRNKLTPQPTVMGGGQPLPDGFEPISATFVGLQTGWALGTLSTPCPTPGCLALARTDNTGATWYSVPTPATGIATASTGVSQVRFLNRNDGWIFGPDLWSTSDGGQHWQQVDTGGRRVVSLEAVRDRAFAVFARCPAGQPLIPNGGAAGCLSYQLYSSMAGTPTWQRVPGATSGPGTSSLVLGRDAGYLLGVTGSTVTLSSGPVSGSAAWTAETAPCQPGQATSPATATTGAATTGAAASGAATADGSVPRTAARAPSTGTSGTGTSGTGTSGTGTGAQAVPPAERNAARDGGT